MAIKLGSNVKDIYTGFRGIVMARCERMDGGVVIEVQPLIKMDGSFNDARWIPEKFCATVKNVEMGSGEQDSPEPRKSKVTPPPSEDSDLKDNESSDDSSEPEEEEGFTAPPVKSPKNPKPPKFTLDDVNDACLERARSVGGKKGREEVLGILKKKFKTQTVSELKPEQYADCIAAMEIS